jgi:hypothetical protein
MDRGVWHDEDFQVRTKLEKPKLELTEATQYVSKTL